MNADSNQHIQDLFWGGADPDPDYVPPEEPTEYLDPWADTEAATAFAQKIVDEQPAPLDGDARGDKATPFQAGIGYARRFPTECLPPQARAYVHDIASRAQVPVDLPALTMLGMVAALAAPRFMVRGSHEWAQPCNLYVMCAMASSAGKSPAVAELRGGMWRAEEYMKEVHGIRMATQMRQLLLEADELETRLREERATLSLEETSALETRMKALRAQATEQGNNPPAPPTFVLDGDATPEALGMKLALNQGQGAIIDDEGTLIRNLGGQYSGGKTGNLSVFLKGYDCDSYRPARVTRDAQPIDRLALGLILAPQPSFIADMMRNGAMTDSGFVNRFLVSLPGDLLGQRVGRKSTFVDDATDEQKDRSLRRWWERLLRDVAMYDVMESHRDLDATTVIDLDREAFQLSSGFGDDFEQRLHPVRGDLAKVANWAGKHHARVLRVAAVLHLLAGKTPDDRIDKATMNAAIEIGDWAIEHFTGIGRVVGLSAGAGQIKEHINGIPAGWCTRTDINKKVFSGKAHTNDMQKWIDELVATKEFVAEKIRTGKGRPTEIVRLWNSGGPTTE